MSGALSLDAKKFPGLANASAETAVSFVTFSFGLAELLWGKSPDVVDLIQPGHSSAGRIELATALMRKKGVIKDDAIVTTISATPASTFPVMRALREHTGMHAENIHSVVRALSNEPERLEEWMNVISKTLQQGGGDVIVLCYDETMGRRASSIAIVLQHLLEAIPTKAKIGDVTHLSRPLWTDRMCGPCAECTLQTSARSASLAVVRKLWQTMAPI